MKQGIVKFYRKDLGWGFVSSEGEDFFVHRDNMKSEMIYSGQEVLFEIVETVRGKLAVNVRTKNQECV